MGKNVYTEIKCHSLLPLDDIVAMVSHPDCIPEVNNNFQSYVNSDHGFSVFEFISCIHKLL